MRLPSWFVLVAALVLGFVIFFSSLIAVSNYHDGLFQNDKLSRPTFQEQLQIGKDKLMENPISTRIKESFKQFNFTSEHMKQFLKIAEEDDRVSHDHLEHELHGFLSLLYPTENQHPAKPNEETDGSEVVGENKDMSCKVSFEPTCDMYSYVRFWNHRFHPEDCYSSPLRPKMKEKTPYDQQKYVVFEPDRGGWNNIRMAAEVAMIFAHATGRTLVLPPTTVWYLLNKNKKADENQSTFKKFFDFNKISESITIITMEEFLTNVAIKSPHLLKAQYPKDIPVEKFAVNNDRLWKWLESACYTTNWEPGKIFIGMNITRYPITGEGVPSPIDINLAKNTPIPSRGQKSTGTAGAAGTATVATANSNIRFQGGESGNRRRLLRHISAGSASDINHDSVPDNSGGSGMGVISHRQLQAQVQQEVSRYITMVAHGRSLFPYNTELHKETAIFFPGDYRNTHRILTHFYTYLYWADYHVEQIYKRIVRDRLHYHDDIFCSAGRVVREIHKDVVSVAQKRNPQSTVALQISTERDPKTHGGNVNMNATYFAYHIRRGDFQYKDTRISAEEIWANTKHLLDIRVTNLIYIATDEKDKSFFKAFTDSPFEIRFLHHYEGPAKLKEDHNINQNHIGMIEQVVCANAHTFIGTQLSTFTGYITRMRGYYRDGRYERTYYTMPSAMYQLQKRRQIVGPFWAREFEVASRDIDDWYQ